MGMPLKRIRLAASLIVTALAVSGCASLGEGIGRAVFSHMEGDPEVDTRACEIHGAPFSGIRAAFQDRDGQGDASFPEPGVVKLMFVHGIGSHHPGYSGETVANLTAALGLNVVSPQIKFVDLADPDFPGESIGTLTAQRFTDEAGARELIVYELTWSRISDRARANLRFDSSQIHTRNRASLNQLAKTFVNDVLVDPLVYVGAGREKILAAMRQAMCWAHSTNWDRFPSTPIPCGQGDPGYGSRLAVDRVFFVTHSLGSRIVLDALETTAEGLYAQLDPTSDPPTFLTNLQNHTVTVFMLANQVPLLQAGFPPVPVTGQIAEYCTPAGSLYERRIVSQTRVIAFSDPNDLLSYPIPDDFVQYGIDSRLCPIIVNASLNIARVTRLLGSRGFANPLTAHTGYNTDARVIGLMTGGLGQAETPAAVTERCSWMRVEEALR